jgi:hypothetical protein
MPTKIRKQIYLEKRQDRQLKRLAEARGVSEAAVIRELIDGQAAGSATNPLPPDPEAWEAILQFIRQRAQSGVTGEPYRWNRDEIYEERMRRFDHRVNDSEERETSPVEMPNQQTPSVETPQKKTPRRKMPHRKMPHRGVSTK